ncbi:MAG: class II fumarate hydratase [Pseudohongiellaceae bacterium]
MGSVEVPENALWGAQTQRSLQHFSIGDATFPKAFIHALCLVKKAAAIVNQRLDLLDSKKAKLIQEACDEILAEKHAEQFPLSVWQTGSGTQTNMNMNEVIANIGNRNSGSALGSKSPLHPNDHVNLSQSSNDVFPTAMHIATRSLVIEKLLPALKVLHESLDEKAIQFAGAVKVARTHMMDATPISLGHEFSAFSAQLQFAMDQISQSLVALQYLAIGGTAVGTGFNSHPIWSESMAKELSNLSGQDYYSAKNFSSQMASHDGLLNTHAQLSGLATALYKIANDLRLMNSGPRCGLGEITIPANEPGSSMMPGKVNPTQIEALTMVCLRVMGNNTTITMANSQGQFQLNTYKPLIIHSLLESIELLSDSCTVFTEYCVSGIEAVTEQLEYNNSRSLMFATALSPTLGYDKATELVHYAHERKLSLRDAVLELKLLSADEFDSAIDLSKMLGPSIQDAK